VQVVERVLVEEMGFVEEEHGMDALGDAVLDVSAERVEQAARRRRGREPDGVAELAVEVAAAERGVVAVGQAEADRGELVAQRAQHAGLAYKLELIERRSWPTRAGTRTETVHWIEAVYNRQRRHSAIDMLSPVDYEERYWDRRAAV
jgi:transposase InsO family protein